MNILIYSWITILLCGHLVQKLFWSCPPGFNRLDRVFRLILSFALGTGLFTIVDFLALDLIKLNVQFLWIPEHVVLLILFLLTLFPKRNLPPPVPENVSMEMRKPVLLHAVWMILIGASAFAFWKLSSELPHGRWDAWAIWNLRARHLYFSSPGQFSTIFDPALEHTDYPLLLPLSVARQWAAIGNPSAWIPILSAAMFTSGMVVLSFIGHRRLMHDRTWVLVASVVLLGTPNLVITGTSQYADIPLAFYILTTIVLLCLPAEMKVVAEGSRYFVLPGITTAFAAWTKNEGILFACAVFVSMFFLCIARRNGKEILRMFIPMLAGFLPIFLVILYFKFQYAPSNDLVQKMHWSELPAKVFSISRLSTIFEAILGTLILGSAWKYQGVIMLISMLVFWRRMISRPAGTVLYSMLIVMTTFCGYVLVYLITPQDLTWHLRTSMDRLLMHLWPAFLFLMFLQISSGNASGQGDLTVKSK